MEVHLDLDESTLAPNQGTGKRRRPAGRLAPSPAEVADQTGRLLVEREPEWVGRLAADPASFAAVEREVHEQARRQADLYVAGLLAKASELPETADHVDTVIAAAEVPLHRLKKKAPPDRAAPGGPGDHGDDPVLLAAGTDRQGPRSRRRWALPGIGGLPVQRGLQSQRAGGSRPAGRSVADRTGSGGVGSSRSGIGRESHWADRGRVGGPDAGHAAPGICSGFVAANSRPAVGSRARVSESGSTGVGSVCEP